MTNQPIGVIMQKSKTVLITGASQGIGAGLVNAFAERGYNVVGTSRTTSKAYSADGSERLALVDGDIGDPATAKKVVETALERFGSIDALVNNAGIFFTKPFLDYTMEDFRKLSSTNLEGFIHLTQLVVRQMLAQKTGGSIVSITTPMLNHPIAGVTASVPMMTKGGIDAISKNLAMEYSKDGIRVNMVAPGMVNTSLHDESIKEFLKTLSPMPGISEISEIVDAVIFLTEASRITGEVLHVDGGAHLGRW
jgi:NAD(P)-dependent dehydrogenase (short-subunit alcohol dehydrogenase family)